MLSHRVECDAAWIRRVIATLCDLRLLFAFQCRDKPDPWIRALIRAASVSPISPGQVVAEDLVALPVLMLYPAQKPGRFLPAARRVDDRVVSDLAGYPAC